MRALWRVSQQPQPSSQLQSQCLSFPRSPVWAGSIRWVPRREGRCLGEILVLKMESCYRHRPLQLAVKMTRNETSAPTDCMAELRPSALPEISPLAQGMETGKSGADSARAVLVTQECLCGIDPINVRCRSQSSRDARAGSAAQLRHPPRGGQHVPFQKHGALGNWVNAELGGREFSKSSGLGI